MNEFEKEIMNKLIDREQEVLRLKDALRGLYDRVSTDKDAKHWFKLEQMNAELALESIKGES